LSGVFVHFRAPLQQLTAAFTRGRCWLVERWNLDSFANDSILYLRQRRPSVPPPTHIRIIRQKPWACTQQTPLPAGMGSLCTGQRFIDHPERGCGAGQKKGRRLPG
jgi:hypothetical protein